MSSRAPKAVDDPAVSESSGERAPAQSASASPAPAPSAEPTDATRIGFQPDGPVQIVALTSAGERRSAWMLLRQPTFRLYFFGALTSNLGTWLQSTAQILIAYQVTHSVFTVGLITSAQFAGMALVSPWAAVVADRVGTKALLIGTQSTSALICLYMAWRYHTGLLGVHTLIVGSLGLGLAFALALPVQTALITALVASEEATNAVKMNSVSYNAGRALAPALCVLVIALVGRDVIFVLNAISFIVFAACLALALSRPASAHRKATTATGCATTKPVQAQRARVTDGLLIALLQPRILLLLAIVAAVTFADDPILVLSPALAHVKLHLSNDWAGYFIAALGWGSVVGSLPPTTARIHNPKSASRQAAISLIVLGVSVIVFTLGLGTSISLAAAVVAGAAGLFTGSAAQTALLRHQTNRSLNLTSVASVAALWAIAWAGTKPFASLLDGWLAGHRHIGIVFTSILLALPALTIALCELWLPESGKERIKSVGAKATSRAAMILFRRYEKAQDSRRYESTPKPMITTSELDEAPV